METSLGQPLRVTARRSRQKCGKNAGCRLMRFQVQRAILPQQRNFSRAQQKLRVENTVILTLSAHGCRLGFSGSDSISLEARSDPPSISQNSALLIRMASFIANPSAVWPMSNRSGFGLIVSGRPRFQKPPHCGRQVEVEVYQPLLGPLQTPRNPRESKSSFNRNVRN